MHTVSRRHRRHSIATLATEGLVWAAYALITAAVLLGLCIALTLAAPS